MWVCSAVLDRAIEERTSMVVEGVHMVPGMLASAGARERMARDPVAVAGGGGEDAEAASQPLPGARAGDLGSKGHRAVPAQFEEIRKIQDFILERAAAEGTLVVDNESIDDTVGLVVDALYDVIEQGEERD